MSNGAKESGNKLSQPRFWPLKGQNNAQAKLRGLEHFDRAAVSFSLWLGCITIIAIVGAYRPSATDDYLRISFHM
jgi:hypothetical protein